jgi:hypothetical protein
MIYDLGAHGGGVGRNSTKAHHEVRAHKNTKVGGRDMWALIWARVCIYALFLLKPYSKPYSV